MSVAVLIFALTYAGIAARRIPWIPLDRPAIALCGAVAMVVTGAVDLDEALAAIDLHVLCLLFGVMVIAATLQAAQFFRFAAWWVLTRPGSARSLLWALVLVSGALSALLVNDTVCLVLTPLVVAVVVEAELPPLPYLLALAAATNVGGVASFSGNPQNMLIGRAAAGDPSFAEYMLLALPAAIAALAACALAITWLFRRELSATVLPPRTAPRPYLDVRLTAKALAALGVFVAASLAGASLAGAAVAAAALLLVVAGTPPREALANVDWALLVFFAGLFVVVGGVERSGALAAIPELLAPSSGAGPRSDALVIGTTVLGSNLVSNVPFVLVAIGWVPSLADPAWGYVLLAATSTLAGNLTLVGSIANLIVFERAGVHGRIGFFGFLRRGVVVTAATLAAALAMLYLARALYG